MRLHRAITALAAFVALAACEENAVQDIAGPTSPAGIRFQNFGINAPQVHLYSGAEKVTANSSTSCQAAANPPRTATDSLCHTLGIEASAGIAYGSVAAGNRYVGIEPGQHTFDARIMTATDKGTTIASVPVTVQAGKLYSYYVSGLYNTTTKKADGFVVEDVFPRFDYDAAHVRFVNASFNAPAFAMSLIDIATGQVIPLGSTAIGYKGASEFVRVPAAGYRVVVRLPGTTTDAVVASNIGLERGVVYTISLRGDLTVTSATAANRPILEVWTNR
ncbi:MAG TPA: DUF4397 domain-containing protein [Gemmatimonadaceae bacterium]|nr:DUF4397 domain-containing protein [Gemmatimonadaceae bacterium]